MESVVTSWTRLTIPSALALVLAAPYAAAAQEAAPPAVSAARTAAPVAPAAQAPVAQTPPPKAPVPNRLNEVLPQWLRVRGEFRERMEGFDGAGFDASRE